MLSAGRYLLGVGEIALILAFAGLAATSLRRRLVPEFSGSTAALATIVVAAALLIWSAELLGSLGAFEALPYLLFVGAVSVGIWALGRRGLTSFGGACGRARGVRSRPPQISPPVGGAPRAPTMIALAIAALAVFNFAADVRLKLNTGMTGFDSTWYHGPFAAGFHQTGNTWELHHIAPQFMAWFYPASAEVFHAIGMNAFDRDLLSPLLNLGWFLGCLLACWAIGRPYRLAPASLALGAVALSVPALSDQAGEARNDIVGIFFLLAAVAIVLASRASGSERRIATGNLLLAGLAAGLAAGTKLNFLLPAAVLVIGLVVFAPTASRVRTALLAGLAALAGGGYWYLRNLVHAGNPLPWFDHLGPIGLPGPSQDLGGREQHSVLSYLGDGGVWSDWFLPGLHQGLGLLWPLLGALALAGLVLCLPRRAGPALRIAGAVGLAAFLSWLVAPTSASGPEGMPRGFESGLRYLAPALVLGLALLPSAPGIRSRLTKLATRLGPRANSVSTLGGGEWSSRPMFLGIGIALVLAIGIGYVVQRDYLRDRYANPTFTTAGLNAAFRWATPISGAKIATTSTRQYPLFGTDLDNEVEFVGEDRPEGGFVAASNCRAWRRLLDEGEYDYVITSSDRVEPGEPSFPATARWTESPDAQPVLAVPPTKVFRLTGPLNPSTCPS
jgi:hypothetical protein